MMRVTVNVGGQKFETTKQTLCGRSEYFTSLFESSEIGNDSEIFIDRDPEPFKHVLGYLRDENYPFPRQLIYELDFFGIRAPGSTTNKEETSTLVPQFKIDNFEALYYTTCLLYDYCGFKKICLSMVIYPSMRQNGKSIFDLRYSLVGVDEIVAIQYDFLNGPIRSAKLTVGYHEFEINHVVPFPRLPIEVVQSCVFGDGVKLTMDGDIENLLVTVLCVDFSERNMHTLSLTKAEFPEHNYCIDNYSFRKMVELKHGSMTSLFEELLKKNERIYKTMKM